MAIFSCGDLSDSRRRRWLDNDLAFFCWNWNCIVGINHFCSEANDREVSVVARIHCHVFKCNVCVAVSGSYGHDGCRIQRDYQELFQLLANELPDIANAMSPIEPLVFNDNTALFRLMRKETVDGVEYDVSYKVYFVRDEDGSWKIWRY